MSTSTQPVRTNYVLIDYENVQPTELAPLQPDHVQTIVFVGAGQAKIPLDIALGLQKLGSRASYIKSGGSGANALDFHIAFYLGALAAREPHAYFHIISKDTGFDPLIQHLREKQVRVYRITCLGDLPWMKALQRQAQAERIAQIVGRLHKQTKPGTVKTLSTTINALFQKQLSEAEIQSLIDALQRQNLISITDGRVSYSLQDAP